MVRPWLALLGSLVLGAPLAAAKLPAAPQTLRLAAVPERPEKAMTGSQFLRRTDGWPEAERQAAALAELERGNMPRSLSRLQPVTLRYQPPKGSAISATIWVTPDYLAIGPFLVTGSGEAVPQEPEGVEEAKSRGRQWVAVDVD